MSRKYGSGGDYHVTPEAVRKLEVDLRRLEAARPMVVEELRQAREMGDLSENAAYQMAKGRLAGIDARMFEIKEKLKRAVIITPGAGPEGRARLGSTMIVRAGGAVKKYQLVGPQETDPAKGRISHLSPLGSALMGKKAGETAEIAVGGKPAVYEIIAVE
jgi:transcription elongation factor GreA